MFYGKGNRITAIKLYNDKFEPFYKEDEKSLYPVCKRSAKYVEGWGHCSICQYFYPAEENKYRCPYDHIPLRTSPRKKRNNSKW
jgi:uncharacterized paraquat-inducible protein A